MNKRVKLLIGRISTFVIIVRWQSVSTVSVWIQIPLGVQISDSCRDLLVRLLQRDPDLRIPYEEFFCHPFLDFEHRPCSEALQKAVSIFVI